MQAATMIVTTIPVSDLDRSKAFYREALGLDVLWESPASVRFECGGGTQLSIFQRPGTATQHTLAHFEATVRELEGRGVTFLDYDEGPLQTTGHIAPMGPARGAWFHDPDGNTLGLRQG